MGGNGAIGEVHEFIASPEREWKRKLKRLGALLLVVTALALIIIVPRWWPYPVYVKNLRQEPIHNAKVQGFVFSQSFTDQFGEADANISLWQIVHGYITDSNGMCLVRATGYENTPYQYNSGGVTVIMTGIRRPGLVDPVVYVNQQQNSVNLRALLSDFGSQRTDGICENFEMTVDGRPLSSLKSTGNPCDYSMNLSSSDDDIKECNVVIRYLEVNWPGRLILVKRFYLNDRDRSCAYVRNYGGISHIERDGCYLAVGKEKYCDIELPFVVRYDKPLAVKFRAKLLHQSATLSIAFGKETRILVGEGTGNIVKIEKRDTRDLRVGRSGIARSGDGWSVVETAQLSEILQTNTYFDVVMLYRPRRGVEAAQIELRVKLFENSKDHVGFQPLVVQLNGDLAPPNFKEKLRIGVISPVVNGPAAIVSDVQVTRMGESPFE